MTVIQGEGDYRYEISNDWAKVPPGMAWREVAAVAVDHKDQVYVFNRGPHPMMVFGQDGNFLRSWGEDIFAHAHGAYFAPDETLYLTDDGDHTVRKCTLDGKVLMTLGIPGSPSPYMSQEPFHRCTHTALSPEGDLYVSDGYGNACVHKYSPKGDLILTWGEPGSGEGEFNLPHNICCDADGWVYVADRESHRVQVFDGKGKYETQWNNLHRPSGLCMPPGAAPSAISASATRCSRSTDSRPISARASASSTARASCWHASATGRAPATRPASSSRPTASPSIPTATSMSARSPRPPGRSSSRTSPCRTR